MPLEIVNGHRIDETQTPEAPPKNPSKVNDGIFYLHLGCDVGGAKELG